MADKLIYGSYEHWQVGKTYTIDVVKNLGDDVHYNVRVFIVRETNYAEYLEHLQSEGGDDTTGMPPSAYFYEIHID